MTMNPSGPAGTPRTSHSPCSSEGWAKMVEMETLFLVVHAYERLRQQASRTAE